MNVRYKNSVLSSAANTFHKDLNEMFLCINATLIKESYSHTKNSTICVQVHPKMQPLLPKPK